ncbi:O-methyltransferase [Grosmannia clavigera kw1407]|uniref:O-methyltransferase n=1 Tax=Grosmannia clavigera (strain kw1407 / UAMH 11150) TaxID=655863 RepID=F0XNS5_GROCL|nr:O-methyltransferase [Grosmannia clavigera kw1407]EFX00311.1 O-methyltransferase [Grosmannia clavigera kw1407]
MYEYISKQPDLHTLFGRLMEGVAASPKSSLKHLVDGFAWGDLGKATVVDLEFIVQDSAHVVKQGEVVIQQNNEAVSKRIRFQEYDFFQEQPVTSADVYLFRQILHNWDFSHSVQILKSTVKSMSEGSHMLVMDFDLPEPGSVPSVNERVGRSRDVVMMQLFNSFERDLSDWKLLFAAVDPRLKINAVNTPFGSFCSVIDLILEG